MVCTLLPVSRGKKPCQVKGDRIKSHIIGRSVIIKGLVSVILELRSLYLAPYLLFQRGRFRACSAVNPLAKTWKIADRIRFQNVILSMTKAF
jgi:hypothetical protein